MSSCLEVESEFNFDELFFSRTNSKGIIESGNSVFQRVSKYDWDEILNKPHNVIRHPTMPRGVFHLLWETILAGKPIGAYVVNRAKDGGYYWVFAVVSPIKDGFLSVRIKPSSRIFEQVKAKYAELLEIERTQAVRPKESQELLIQAIMGLGFRSYQHFMTEAMTQELESRQKSLGLPPIRVIAQLREVLKLGSQLQKKCEDIFSAYYKSALVPLNLEVQAARIGEEAASISVISTQYHDLAKQIHAETMKFMGAGNLVQQKVEDCQFDVCNSLLQKEMFLFFKNEDRPTPIQKDVEMGHLEALEREGLANAKAGLGEIDAEFVKFKAVYEEVRMLSTALEIVSVTGKIEAAKIMQSSGELLSLLNDLVTFKSKLKSSLREIDGIGNDLIARTRDMRNAMA